MDPQEIEQLARAVAAKLQERGWIESRNSGPRLVAGRPSVRPSDPLSDRLVVQPPTRGESAVPRDLKRPGRIRVADFIDHTLLKAETTRDEIVRLCLEAKEHRFAAVCVNGCWVSLCAEMLTGTGVKVAAVAGFPLGAMMSGAKASEVRQLVGDGADEIDMVAPIGHVIDEAWDYVEDDISAVVEAAGRRVVKVILETAALDSDRIIKASAIAKEAGAAFVKTSTGFHPAGGATAEAVALMRAAVGQTLGVKAAGGIRDCATALTMLAAGATRLGTSSGVKLVDCLGNQETKLEDLLARADKHDGHCKMGSCQTDSY